MNRRRSALSRPRTFSPQSARVWIGLTVACAWLVCGSAWAHVAFDNPTAGAVLAAGTQVEVRWRDTIPHQTTAYHLQFRPGGDAAGVPIADLEPTEHALSWLLPETACDDCSLYIVQDNEGSDYVATLPISIVTGDAGAFDAGTADTREASGMHVAPNTASQTDTATGIATTEPPAPTSEVAMDNPPGSVGSSCALIPPSNTTPPRSAWGLFGLAFGAALLFRRQ